MKIIGFLPTIGILVFVCLYVYSSLLYPGGSQANLKSAGFDWFNNYWCNLMNERAMNEVLNPARPYAISAMVILCMSLMLFFVQFARNIAMNRFWKLTIPLFGTLSMTFSALIFTEYHDSMTALSSIFGVFMVVGIIREVYKSNMTTFKISGIICIVLLGLNNYIYYSHQFIQYLPFLQKITFALVLGWIVGLNFQLTQNNVSKHL